MSLKIENILKVLENAASKTITVFGDYCLDKYLYIDPARDEDSVETGLTAYQVDKIKLYPGAGGTITNNLRSLGVCVRCVGLVGEDGEGYDLLKCLKQVGADAELMVQSEAVLTNTYMKPMRKTSKGTYSEMNRIDIRNFQETSKELEEKLIENLIKSLDDSQGVVIIDQFMQRNNAAVTDRIREVLSTLSLRFPDKFFLADSRGFIDSYRNITIKCNRFELHQENDGQYLYSSESQRFKGILKRARQLRANNGGAVVVTLGDKGAVVIEDERIETIPAFSVEGPLDIVGAGDATNAGIIWGLTLGLTLPEAVLLGGCISSITIQQIGVTGVATIEQIIQRFECSQNILS